MTPLGKHVGHRTTPLDDQRLRCVDCSHTIVLPSPTRSTSTSKTSAIPGPDDPRCPQHQHEHATSCRSCAADRKADEHRTLVHQPTANVEARAAEARAALPGRRERHPAPSLADPDRMATARAELDQLRASQQPIDAEEPADA